ncbi:MULTISPECIES: CHAT domain-containing protein [unclassified Streptomyces]|uniref:CHAT domain-containing protein n=1 Tax=unclassified Streptomyces TaxID=2593676 RepID=UPI0033F27D23
MAYDDRVEEIRAARRELDDVVREVQGVEIDGVREFASFLAPPTMDDIAEAASGSPLVYLTAAEPGGLALIVRGAEVEHVPLPMLTARELRDRVAPYLTAHARDKDTSSEGGDAWRTALDDITRWLWPAVMEPVLRRLPGPGAATLVAGGLLGLLPLHAAWTEDTSRPAGRRYALDHRTLNYVPNARALSAARAMSRIPARRLVTVAAPTRARPGPPLEYAGTEASVAGAAFPGAAPVMLAGDTAGARAVAEALREADVAHLACHGKADLAAPLESHLLLAGTDRLRLRDLLTLRLRLRLAVLSACETLVPGTDLPDEVVALPTGLLQAGAAGVLASLWEVGDVATAMLMTEFYRLWRHREEPVDPPEALALAQSWMRDTTNAEKLAQYAEATAAKAPWLPTQAARRFRLALRTLPGGPEARSYAHPDHWAGFAYVGV